MKARIQLPIAAALALAVQAGALAQSTQPVPPGDPAASTSAGTDSNTAPSDPVVATPAPRGESPNYVERITPRFGEFAGSEDNLRSLVGGLRTGGEITLSDAAGDMTFTAPTRPMGYGNITRTLDYAQRQLEAAGVTQPTSEQLHAALVGGTVTGAHGDVTLQGVLHLRSEGMGWGKIAHTLGIPPSAHAKTPQSSASRITTPVSGGGASATTSAKKHSGSGGSASGAPAHHARAYSRITTPLGPVSSSYAHANRGHGHGPKAHGVSTAAGAPASAAGVSNGGGKGNGNAYGRVGK